MSAKADRKRFIKLFRDGTPVEAGWQNFRDHWAHAGCSQRQLDDMRMVFFAGATHIWSLLALCVDAEDDTNEGDPWYAAINNELIVFAKRILAERDKRRQQ